MKYHLVDEVKGDGNSRRIIHSFEYFQDVKDWIIANVDDLYGFIEGYDSSKAPYLRDAKSLSDLNMKLHGLTYHGWRLTVIGAKEVLKPRRRVLLNIEPRTWITIRPIRNVRGSQYTNKGISWSYLQTLTKEEQEIITNARLMRVLQKTERAVLVEWSGRKGSSVTWIPKQAIAN